MHAHMTTGTREAPGSLVKLARSSGGASGSLAQLSADHKACMSVWKPA